MGLSLLQIFIALLAGVLVIVILTAKFHVHAFFALLIACFIVGAAIQLPFAQLINSMKDGFGSIMRSLGLIIVLGTTLGVLLEYTGSTRVMADFILKKVGERNAALAMSITGFIVGLPIFCDSGYVVLSGLNKSLAKRTGIPVVVMSVSLASGLYAVHCLIPPHPGATAAAATIGINMGKQILTGIGVAIPGMLAGYAWARYAGRKIHDRGEPQEETPADHGSLPSVVQAFLPVIVPIVLIAIQSFFAIDPHASTGWGSFIAGIGDPVVALAIGVLLAFAGYRRWKRATVSRLLHDAVEKAGGILIIIGAGGAFGAVLSQTHIGDHFATMKLSGHWGLLFPFLLTFILKTAQGSSTVAIITAASIIHPLLPALGLTTDTERLLAVLSMGAGSMMISHANDAYFWVITKFSGLEMRPMLKVYSLATLFMGLVTLLTVYILFFILV